MLFNEIKVHKLNVKNNNPSLNDISYEMYDESLNIKEELDKINEAYVAASYNYNKYDENQFFTIGVSDTLNITTFLYNRIYEKFNKINQKYYDLYKATYEKYAKDFDKSKIIGKTFNGFEFVFKLPNKVVLKDLLSMIKSSLVNDTFDAEFVKKIKDDYFNNNRMKFDYFSKLLNYTVSSDRSIESECKRTFMGSTEPVSITVKNDNVDKVFLSRDKYKEIINETIDVVSIVESIISSTAELTKKYKIEVDAINDKFGTLTFKYAEDKSNDEIKNVLERCENINLMVSFYTYICTITQTIVSSRLDAIKEFIKQTLTLYNGVIENGVEITISESLDYNSELLLKLNELYDEFFSIKHELLLREGSIVLTKGLNLKLLTEVDEKKKESIKEKLKKLIDIIIKLWNEFVNKAIDLVERNNKFLNDNKEKILSSDCKAVKDYEMYPYWKGEGTMNSATIPNFSTSDSFMESLSSKSVFREKYFKDYLDKEGNFVNVAKSTFRGGELISANANDIKPNIRAMFNYCINYKNEINKLRNDRNKLESVVNNAINRTNLNDSLFLDLEMNYLHKIPLCERECIENVNKKFTLISEAEDIKNNKQEQTNNDQSNNQNTTKNDNQEQKNNSQSNNQNQSNNNEPKKSNFAETDKYELYVKECYNFLSCKMSIMEEKYLAYMRVLVMIAKS